MANSDQDVTLDEMAVEVSRWYDENSEKVGNGLVVEPCGLKDSLDVIREVEEVFKGSKKEKVNLRYKYSQNLEKSTRSHEFTLFEVATADAETRLRAIYKTLKEAGELNGT